MNCEPNIHTTIVYDIGSAMIRIGFAGDAFPMISQPSFVAYKRGEGDDISLYFEDKYLYSTTQHFDISYLINDSYSIPDPALLSHFFLWSNKYLGLNSGGEDSQLDAGALFTQPAHLIGSDSSFSWSKTLLEVGFENISYPSICIAADASLGCYAHCMQTATVIDFGWSSMRITPVIEGKSHPEFSRVHPIGGFGLSHLLYQQLASRSVDLSPKSFVDNPFVSKLSEAQIAIHQRKLSTDVIHTCCTFANNALDEDFLYFLSGSGPIDLKNEMKVMSSLYFREILSDETEQNVPSLPELIKSSISDSPDQSKRDLWSNIVTCGGFSSINSFVSKVQATTKKVAGDFDVKVHHPMHRAIEGDLVVWVGGSIFASSSIFPRFCITKSEWEENGESIINVKCT